MALWHDGKEIATNGLHVGTPVNGKMFDNLHPDGLDITKWKNKFEFPPHLELREDIIEASQKIEDIY